MTNGAKKIGLYAGIGVLAAILIITGVGFSGFTVPSLRFPDFFSPSPTSPTTGTLIIKVSDKPTDLAQLNLTIDSVLVHRKGGGNGTWVNLPFVNNVSEVTFDLLLLQNVTMDLSIGEIPPGNYTEIRMHVKAANATYTDGYTDVLTIPDRGELKIIIKRGFTIKAGQGTTLLIDIQPDKIHISQSKNFKPVVKATVIT